MFHSIANLLLKFWTWTWIALGTMLPLPPALILIFLLSVLQKLLSHVRDFKYFLWFLNENYIDTWSYVVLAYYAKKEECLLWLLHIAFDYEQKDYKIITSIWNIWNGLIIHNQLCQPPSYRKKRYGHLTFLKRAFYQGTVFM